MCEVLEICIEMNERDSTTVQSTKTSFAVLRTLREHGGAGVTEVAKALDIPKSTAHKHLHTLAALGYATNESGLYDVGLPFAGLGQYARTRNPLFRAARPEVETLAETTEEVAGLFVERNDLGFDVYRHADGAVGETNGPLSSFLHCTAPGKAILAELSDDRVDDIIGRYGLPARTDQTITSRADLTAERERIRDRGIAFDREESREHVHGVAVPVMDDGVVRGAIYVVGAQRRLTGKWFDENIPGVVLSAVNTIEQRLRER